MRHFLFDIPLDDLDSSDINQIVTLWLSDPIKQHIVVTPNPEFLLLAQRNKHFRNLLNQADLSLPDGVGLRFGIAALTENRLKHRHTGVDFVETLVMSAEREGKRILFFGGDKASAEKARIILQKKYPGAQIDCFDPGKISGFLEHLNVSDAIIDHIRSLAPNILLVALGQGKQEQFIFQTISEFPTVQIAAGVGGSFSSISGNKPRAPRWMRTAGIEWVWRVAIQPSRAHRILSAVIVFPIIVIYRTLKQQRFLKAFSRVIPEIYRQLKGL